MMEVIAAKLASIQSFVLNVFVMMIQVNLYQRPSFCHQLIQNIIRDLFVIYLNRTCREHVLFKIQDFNTCMEKSNFLLFFLSIFRFSITISGYRLIETDIFTTLYNELRHKYSIFIETLEVKRKKFCIFKQIFFSTCSIR